MRRGTLLLVLLIANILLASATHQIGNASHSISTKYGPSADLQGWINVSILNEAIGTIVTDSFSNQINILDLLKSDDNLVEDTDYSCNPIGCGATYSSSNGETSKTFTLNDGESKVIGFKFDGTSITINDPEINIASNAIEDCSNQLKIDFYEDGIIDTGNDKIGPSTCGLTKKDYGCYNEDGKDLGTSVMDGDNKMYCQIIELEESPGFRVGAWLEIINDEYEDPEITKMVIYDIYLNEQLDECDLPDMPTPTGGKEVSCDIDYLVAEKADYYVCITNDEGIDENTKLRSYSDSINGCGFYTSGSYVAEETHAYRIFAEGKKFDPFGTLEIIEDSHFDNLGGDMSTYIYNAYGSTDCPSEGCVVPIKFISKQDQNITIDGIHISYATGEGPKITEKVYDLELSSARVSTDGFKKISFSSAGFLTSTSIGSILYSILIDDDPIFTKNISVEPVPEIVSITPSIAFTQFPTNFHVDVDELANVSIDSYTWKFGNANPKTTSTNKVSHTFYEIGLTPVLVTVTDLNGKTGSKTFTIDVGDYLGLFSQKLTEAQANILNVTGQLATFSQFYQEGILQVLDAGEITRQLTAIENAKDAASTDDEYTQVVNDFLSLEVPLKVFEKVNTNYVSYYTDSKNVNVNVIQEFLGGDLGSVSEFEYAAAVSDWNVRNLDSQIKFKKINANYPSRSGTLVNIFDLNVKQTGDTESPSYVFIRQLENMKFDKDYGETVKAGYIQIPLGGLEKTISFLTTEDVDITTVPIFVSPALQSLTLINLEEEEDVQGMKWALFVVIIFFLILVAFVAYIFLQHWYKTKYENYLFKNRNFLFNLIHYIDAQKKKGAKDNEIFRKLRKQGWNSEQINYVIRKYLGQRTGMLEIPVEKILGWFKKQPTPTQGGPPRPGMRPPRRPPMRRPRGLKKRFPGK